MLYLLSLITAFQMSQAEFRLTNNLNAADRTQLVKTLGLSTSSKNLTSVKPLGSDSGLEVSFIMEMMDIDNVSQYITSPGDNNFLYYPKILIGKGLFERADIFFHFIPYTESLGLSEVGAMFRYNFFRSSQNLFYSSLLLHGSSANFNNQLTTRNIGGDLLMGLDWESFALFSGIGHARSVGKFNGGTFGVTDSMNNQQESTATLHVSLGGVFRYSIMSLTLSYDRYDEEVYTAKFGFTW